MNPETYCGASDEHINFNNHKLKSGEPVKLFGIDGFDEKTVWLDMKNCSGTLDSATFSLLSNLEYISMENCNFERCSKVFAPLNKLASLHVDKGTFPLDLDTFEDNTSITSLSLQGINVPISPCFQYLKQLESITFDTCVFQNLNKIVFSELKSLKGLSISHCKIQVLESNLFDELADLEGLNIRDTEIEEIDFEVFSKLTNLKFFSFHHNKINGNIDYTIFEQLPLLTTIHLDLGIYETLNFESFPHLQTVKIGYIDDEEDPKTNELVETLNSKGIKTEYVFCGTLEFDSDIEECY